MKLPVGWLVTLISVLLVALMTSMLTAYLGRIAQRYLEGDTHYNFRNHVAVFGYHEMLPGLLRQLMNNKEDDRLFVILTNKVEKARRELYQVLTEDQMSRLILQQGDITSPVGKYMHLPKANEIFILGEEMQLGADSAHDASVLQCLTNIVDHVPAPVDIKDRVLCHVMFEHHSTFAVFQHTDLNNKVFEKLSFLPFNYYEMWAMQALVNDSLAPAVSQDSPYLPLEGVAGIGEESSDHAHIVIVGMSRMGVSMGIMAAHLGHYPNFINHPERKTRITFIDRNGRNEMYRLQGRLDAMFQVAPWRYMKATDDDYGYSAKAIDDTPWHNPMTDSDSVSPYKSASDYLGRDFVDIEWEFIDGDVENPSIQNYIEKCANDKHTRLTVAICVPDSNKAVAIGVNLPYSVYENAVQVLVYQRTGEAIMDALSTGTVAGFTPYSKMRAFGMSSGCYDLDLVRKLVYIACKEGKEGKPSLQEMVSSESYRRLASASNSKSAAANMWSTIYRSAHMWTKLRSVGSKDGSIPVEYEEVLGEAEHIRWNVEQLLTQFRPLYEKEQKEVLRVHDSEAALKKIKDDLKRTRFAHLDICSIHRLKEVDLSTVSYDLDNVVRKITGNYRGLNG